ncbi:MAG TPA: hypothetical protein VFY29_21045 [Terriglobia bacterium]|nr:hypothetical protein [Terriglobia bacterium]
MRIKLAALFTLFVLLTTSFIVAQQPLGKDLLDRARAKKSAGDLQSAMESLEAILSNAGTDRNTMANALLEMGAIADSLGQASKARGFYERVRSEFKDQQAEAATATTRLAAGVNSSEGPSRITIHTLHSDDVYSFAISPDGRMLVFQGVSPDGKRQLWRQEVDASKKPEPIAGTEGASQSSFPFFSPDGKSIAFFSRQKLWQVDLAGGVPRELADAPTPAGGDWKGGSILMSARGLGGGIDVVENGRTRPANSAVGFFNAPKFLNDRRFMYFAKDANGGGQIALGSLDGETLTGAGIPMVHAAAFSRGFLVFVTVAGTLDAIQFDPNELIARGASIGLANSVGKEDRYRGIAAFAVSAEGAVAYRETAVLKKQLLWMDRTGALLGTVGAPDSDSPSGIHLSPDGRTAIYYRQGGTPLGSLWAVETTGIGAPVMLQNFALGGLWSPNGDQILHASMNGQVGGVVTIRPVAAGAAAIGAAGFGVARGAAAGGARPVNTPGGFSAAYPNDWGSNGFILYNNGSGGTNLGGDLWALPPNQGAPVSVARSPGSERNGRFSPDSNWVAYQSDETGRNEIYVVPFPSTENARQRVSLSGGTNPVWGRNGKELFFIGSDNRLMVTSAEASVNGEKRSIEFGTPKALFTTPVPPGSEFDYDRNTDRFFFLSTVDEPAPIIVLSNWIPAR